LRRGAARHADGRGSLCTAGWSWLLRTASFTPRESARLPVSAPSQIAYRYGDQSSSDCVRMRASIGSDRAGGAPSGQGGHHACSYVPGIRGCDGEGCVAADRSSWA
jgi:hypothetical protein